MTTKAKQLADALHTYNNPKLLAQAAAELRRLAPMEAELDKQTRRADTFESAFKDEAKITDELKARVKELEDAFLQVRHSITQAKIVGNDWRRELDLINNITNAALGETK